MDPDLERQLDELMTAGQAATVIAAGTLATHKKTLREWLALCPRDSAGVPYWPVDTSGKLLSTETSAASSLAVQTYSANPNPTFGNHSAGTPYERRIGYLSLTTDGAGVASGTLVPALPGYTGHYELIGLYTAAGAGAGITLTMTVTAGTLIGPPIVAVTSIDYIVIPISNATQCGLHGRGTVAADDNKNIGVSMAGGGNVMTYWLIYFYWYET